MNYQYAKLRGAIKEKYRTQNKFAKALGLSERTVSLKLSGKHEWRPSEIERICALLGIPDSQICEYFFTRLVQH